MLIYIALYVKKILKHFIESILSSKNSELKFFIYNFDFTIMFHVQQADDSSYRQHQNIIISLGSD